MLPNRSHPNLFSKNDSVFKRLDAWLRKLRWDRGRTDFAINLVDGNVKASGKHHCRMAGCSSGRASPHYWPGSLCLNRYLFTCLLSTSPTIFIRWGPAMVSKRKLREFTGYTCTDYIKNPKIYFQNLPGFGSCSRLLSAIADFGHIHSHTYTHTRTQQPYVVTS